MNIIRSIAVLVAASAGLVLVSGVVPSLVPAATAAEKPGAVHVMVSNGFKAVMEEITPEAEHSIGHPLAFEFDTSVSIKRRIEGGEAFDVVVFTPEAVVDLTKKQLIASGSSARIARAGIGVGTRTGAPKPDISTPAAMKQTLLKAKSITFTGEGASRATIEEMFEHLGVMGEVKPKLMLTGANAAAQKNVAEGRAEMVITLISEILPIPGIELVGPLPKEFQKYVVFDAGVSTHAANEKSAKELVQFLASPARAATIKAKGMEAH